MGKKKKEVKITKEAKKEIIITLIILIVSVIAGFIAGKSLFDMMH